MGISDVVNGMLLVGALATASIGATVAVEKSAYGQERMTVEDLYRTSKPANRLLPGARVKRYKKGAEVDGEGTLLRGNMFADALISDPTYSESLQLILGRLDGKVISDTSTGTRYVFDFQRFYGFVEKNKDRMCGVEIWEAGYLTFCLEKRGRPSVEVAIPIPKATAFDIIGL